MLVGVIENVLNTAIDFQIVAYVELHIKKSYQFLLFDKFPLEISLDFQLNVQFEKSVLLWGLLYKD